MGGLARGHRRDRAPNPFATSKGTDEMNTIYTYLCNLYGFDPLAERDLIAEAEALLAEARA